MVARLCRREIALLTLASCLCATGARAQVLQRGIVIDRVECADDTAQTYALYLPSDYAPDRPWRLLLAFHPAARGRLMVAAAVGISAQAAQQGAQLKEMGVDCVVLDIQLGGMSGIELGKLLAASKDHHAPVVYITAFDDPETRARAEAAGCAAYFRKNDSGAEVLETIRRLTA